jgi:hypothetical protein
LEENVKRQPKPRQLKGYDKTTVAKALAAYDISGKLSAACEASGVYARETIHDWIARRDELGFPASMAVQTLQDMYNDAKHDLMRDNLRLQKRALAAIERGIDKLGASQAAVVYGILTDKMGVMLQGDGAQAEASVTQRAEKLGQEDRDRIIRMAAKIISRDDQAAGAIDVEYTAVEGDAGDDTDTQ